MLALAMPCDICLQVLMFGKHASQQRECILNQGFDDCQGPGIIKAVFGSFRGYAGNISAAGALDAVSNDGNTLIIDIRCLAMEAAVLPLP